MCTRLGSRFFYWIFVLLILKRVNLASAVTEILLESEFGEEDPVDNSSYTYTFLGGAIGGAIGGFLGGMQFDVHSLNASSLKTTVLCGWGGAIGGAVGGYLDGGNVSSTIGGMVGGHLGGSLGGYLGAPAVKGVQMLLFVVLYVIPNKVAMLMDEGYQGLWKQSKDSHEEAMSLLVIHIITTIFLNFVVGGLAGGMGGGYGAHFGAQAFNHLAIVQN